MIGEVSVFDHVVPLAVLETAKVRGGRAFLTERELAEYVRLTHVTRRKEWLAARVCVKTLLMDRGFIKNPRSCEVAKDDKGRPFIKYLGKGRHRTVDCSISHKGKYVAAVLTGRKRARVGVDIERVGPKPAKLRGGFTNPADHLMIPESDVRFTALWAVKEACSKVVGDGLWMGLSDLVCREKADGLCEVRHPKNRQISVKYLLHDDYVIAIAFAACWGRGEQRNQGAKYE